MSKKVQAKRQNLIDALVNEFGEGAIITKQELLSLYKKKTKKTLASKTFPHTVSITKDPDLRIKRGHYLVTSSNEPGKVKEAVLNALGNAGVDVKVAATA